MKHDTVDSCVKLNTPIMPLTLVLYHLILVLRLILENLHSGMNESKTMKYHVTSVGQ